MRTIAIVGSGPTAIYTVRHLLSCAEELSITVFESQAEAGKGTPYHQDWNAKEMLSNIASIEIPPVTETLVHWLEACNDQQLAEMGITREEIDERTFFPRVALGEYFKAQLKKLVTLAPESASKIIIKTCHKVEDIKVLEEGIELLFKDKNSNAGTEVFDYVIMATGHVWPEKSEIRPGYFLSPWPARALSTIKDCHVGIRGTSLTAIDAVVALACARGMFRRDMDGELNYLAEPGTEPFRVTLMSRKGLLPEADFYYPIPYLPLKIFTKQAMEHLIHSMPRAQLLDNIFSLFKAELVACDPAYAERINLKNLPLEEFAAAYFAERERHDPFVWAARNLAEAKANQERRNTVAWRYAILRMHEIIALAIPKFTAEDYQRFNAHFKSIFVDDYATVPHESIERLLALHCAGKLDILRMGEEYELDTKTPETGAILSCGNTKIHFPAFIEATGQRALSAHEFPFPSLWEQGIVQNASASHTFYTAFGQRLRTSEDIGGIALDNAYHPVSDYRPVPNFYCLSLPFLLSQFPFAQGITSSNAMGKEVAMDMVKQWASEYKVLPLLPCLSERQAI